MTDPTAAVVVVVTDRVVQLRETYMMRQRVGMVVVATLFVAACATASTSSDTGVLSAQARAVGTLEPDATVEAAAELPAPSPSPAPRAADSDDEVDTPAGPETTSPPPHLTAPDDDGESEAAPITTAPPEPAPVLEVSAAPAPTTTVAPPPTTVAPAPTTTVAPTTTTVAPPPTTAPPPPPPTTAPPAATADPGAASSFVGEINALRAGAGLPGLARSGDLDARAQSWALTMAESASLRHSTIINALVGGGWMTAGENVGYGPSVGAIFSGLRNSSGHYANMVNGSFTHVGVGVVVIDGVMWTTHLFAG